MTTQAVPADIQVADYILSRLTSYLGNRPDYFAAFIDGNVRGEGWLPAEAFFALSTPVARKTAKVFAVRGKSQGSAKFEPDLEIGIGREHHQLAVIPALATADRPLSAQLDRELAEAFQWVTKLKARSMLYLVAYPSSLEDKDWKAALAKAEQKYHVKPLGQMEFMIPRAPRPLIRAAVALFLEESRVPAPKQAVE
ncbi:MAG: hypothetical protein AAB303_01790 [Chloroflexota bacterium]